MKIMLDTGAFLPVRGHKDDAGLDLRTPYAFTIAPRSSVKIDTGVHVEILPGLVGMLKSKSGLNVNHGITSEGVIDAGYTGSIVAKLYNHGDKPVRFDEGDKITQCPYIFPTSFTLSRNLAKQNAETAVSALRENNYESPY